MADTVALLKDLPDALVAPVRAYVPARLTFETTHSLSAAEADWRALVTAGVESPGQDFDFVQLWTEALGIREADQFYLTARQSGRAIALLPLHRRWVRGVRTLTWFPGPHVGCNAPLADTRVLAAMTASERRTMWQAMLRNIAGADVVYLKSVPQMSVHGLDLFAELGQAIEVETLYRAQFASWEDANTTQRNKSRRKHDRQQGERLEALGAVSFETLGNSDEALAVLDIMFRQRAARFRAMGVWDPFAVPAIRAFYDSTVLEGSGVAVKLHLLRLDGEIVAVRYNIVEGDRLFCLISSMSDDPAIQGGSPGKQCLLRVMQTEFDAGYRMFDMGAGFTDEKRHWCNIQLPVRQHYLPITRRGALAAAAHRNWALLRQRIKSDPRLLKLAKSARGLMLRLAGKAAGVED